MVEVILIKKYLSEVESINRYQKYSGNFLYNRMYKYQYLLWARFPKTFSIPQYSITDQVVPFLVSPNLFDQVLTCSCQSSY